MRIGFDVSQTGANKAGCGVVAHSLINHLAKLDKENFYILYSNFGDFFWDPDHKKTTFRSKQPNMDRRFSDFSFYKAKNFWHNPPSDFEDQLGNPDIIHSNNFFCPTGLRHARLIYTLYDLSFLEHPEFTTEANRLICFDGVFKASLYADRIISISEYTKKHFLKIFPHYPSERITVLHPASRFSLLDGMDDEAGRFKKLPPDSFWLSVGTLEPRKNIRRLLQAYAELRHRGLTDIPLVMAGGKGWLEEEIPDYLIKLGLKNKIDVYLLGYVSDLQLRWLYRHCFAFVYPSLFEGFGVPVLEAMSLGAAVITSNKTSLPEICDHAAIQVDPEDVESLVEALFCLQNDAVLRGNLQKQSLAQAELFSWERMAKGVLAVYNKALLHKS
jgi:glycosyltransferase involved in cell wall biosynthesis